MSDDQPDGPYGLGFSRFWYTLSPNFRGMVLMGVFAAVVSVSHTIVRALSTDIHTMEIALFRAIIPLFVLTPMLLRQGRRSGAIWWRTTRPGLQLIRGVFGGLSMIAWFYALSLIPVGDATALSFTVVMFAAVGASLFLSEQVGIRRWSAIAIGIVGTLIILRPGAQAISQGAIIAISSSLLWAAALLTVKVLSRTDSSTTIVFYSSITFSVLTIGPAIYYWTWPTFEQFGLLCSVGLMALIAQMSMTTAIRDAETTAVMPIDFTRLIWASAVGYVWFGEFPDLWTWIGGSIVFASTLYITYRESRVQATHIGPAA